MNLSMLMECYGGAAVEVEECFYEAVEPVSLEEEPAGQLVEVPSAYMVLFEACHSVALGAIELVQWQSVWAALADQMESSLLAVERQLPRLDRSRSDVHDRLLYGLRGALEALDSMASYLEVEDPGILNRGWMALLEATVDIQNSTRELALN